jgi:hypothetical protein
MKRARTSKKLGVGTEVRFQFGGRDVVATVIEDRGPLGVGGVQILRVRLAIAGTDEVMEFEVPATDVSAAA